MAENFLALESPYCDYQTARFAVLPVPCDATVSFLSGTRNGPAAIIRASEHLEEFDEELGREFYQAGIATLKPIEPDPSSPKNTLDKIFDAASEVVADGKFLFSLGGDHSITSGLVRAVRQHHGDLSVLQIDAHTDLRNEYDGTPFSHACAMRRVTEHGTTVVPVGIRAMSLEERDYAKTVGITPFTARECHQSADWIDRAVSQLSQEVYVTIDIDGFDPAYAPGTGTPEPGGLDWYQVTALLERVSRKRTIVAADVVEVAPLPGQAVTEFLAARVAYKIMSYVQLACP